MIERAKQELLPLSYGCFNLLQRVLCDTESKTLLKSKEKNPDKIGITIQPL